MEIFGKPLKTRVTRNRVTRIRVTRGLAVMQEKIKYIPTIILPGKLVIKILLLSMIFITGGLFNSPEPKFLLV